MLSNANGAESANVGVRRPWVRRRQRCPLGCRGCFASPDAIEVLFGVSKVRAAVARATVRWVAGQVKRSPRPRRPVGRLGATAHRLVDVLR